jgi:hypothetical protein
MLHVHHTAMRRITVRYAPNQVRRSIRLLESWGQGQHQRQPVAQFLGFGGGQVVVQQQGLGPGE